MPFPLRALASVMCVLAVACNNDVAPSATERASATPKPSPEAGEDVQAGTNDKADTNDEKVDPEPELNKWVTRRPSWLGTRVLPKGIQGFGEVQPTPPLMRNRRFATIDIFPPPRRDRFVAHISRVPQSVVERSTWRPKCPVTLEQLRYIKMTFWGFDHRTHMGEFLTNAAVAEDIVDVFRQMYRARFPIEEMRVLTLQDQRAKPTGDGNITSSFECRKVTLGETWSQHAYGLAIDINPFHNPYLRGEIVAPELAPAYTDRSWVRPGMIIEGDAVVRAFDALGWGWGGRWSSLRDWMHFSQNGH